MRQSHLPGVEPPAHPDIEEAVQGLREARDAARRAAELAKEREELLIARMIDAKVQKHRFHCDGRYVDVEVTLPSPSLKVRVTNGGDDAAG